MSERDEAALVLLAQTGNRAALGDLLERVQPRLRGYLQMLTRDDARADDVLQDTFVIAVRKLRVLRDPTVFRAWMYRIATREAYRRRRPADLALEDTLEVTGGDLSHELAAVEQRERLRALVAALPDRAREVIALHYFDEMALDEIAAVLDAPIGTVKSRLAYGLARLRKDVNDV
jgi:RNA polymerase sigma-70 factor, ECF subfamily